VLEASLCPFCCFIVVCSSYSNFFAFDIFESPEEDIMERRAMKKLNNQGILVVAASGNTYDDTKLYPAGYPEVMSVGAVLPNKQIADFSTFNKDVDMTAPGFNVLSTLPMSGDCLICHYVGYRYALLDGTSMAAPHVAGVAALLWSAKPDATVDEITEAIQKTAEDLGEDGKDKFYGHGFVLAFDALEHLHRSKSGKKHSSSGDGKRDSSGDTKRSKKNRFLRW
jgi:subtilisin family serine protease